MEPNFAVLTSFPLHLPSNSSPSFTSCIPDAESWAPFRKRKQAVFSHIGATEVQFLPPHAGGTWK